MLKRKIEDALIAWKNKPGHKPLVIMGIRQCGKTFIAQHFAAENYKNVIIFDLAVLKTTQLPVLVQS